MTITRSLHARGTLWVLTAAMAFVLSGCGESTPEGMGTSSEEHKAATNKMAEFMKTKGKK